MRKISYTRHRFPSSIIQRAVWLYSRFPPSFRELEERLAERGIDVSSETIRRWILKFGPVIAANVRPRRVELSEIFHLDEVIVRIAGRRTQAGDQLDTIVLHGHGIERGSTSASRSGLQSRCLPARNRIARGDSRLVVDQPPDTADQNRRKGHPSRPRHQIPIGRGGSQP